MSKKIQVTEIVEPCGTCGSTNPHCCRQPFQLLEIYTDRDPLSVTSLGFFDTLEDAKKHLEDFLMEEVAQDPEGKVSDYFDIKKEGGTVYMSNSSEDFEWHIIQTKQQQ
jgi:hypothetical protein